MIPKNVLFKEPTTSFISVQEKSVWKQTAGSLTFASPSILSYFKSTTCKAYPTDPQKLWWGIGPTFKDSVVIGNDSLIISCMGNYSTIDTYYVLYFTFRQCEHSDCVASW